MTTTGPVGAGARIGALDILRGVAVCGILLMNIPMMGLPELLNGHPPKPVAANADWIAFTVQNIGFAGSMRGLFTFLFGAGMMVMLRDLTSQAADPPAQAYFTRCFALMLLGVAQFALFLWPGEILFNYGVAGLALFLFRKAQVRVLFTAAAAILVTTTIAMSGPGLKTSETLRAGEAAVAVKAAGKTLTEDQTKAIEAREEVLKKAHPTKADLAKERTERTSFPGILLWSTEIWTQFNLTGEAVISLGETVGFMLLGCALFRLNILGGERSMRFYVLLTAGGYALGLSLRGFRHYLQWQAGFEPVADLVSWGSLVYEAGRLPTTIGLMGLVLVLYKAGALRALETGIKAIGRLALTNYIGQSVITSILFYGLGYFDRIGFAGLMGVCVLVWIAQGVFSVLWLRRWEMGPAEWLLRSLTYGRWQPLGRARSGAVAAAAE